MVDNSPVQLRWGPWHSGRERASPAEELGPPDKKNYITEAYVDYTQESLVEQRFPDDLDYDDATIGKALSDACRRRADHSDEEACRPVCRRPSVMIDRGDPLLAPHLTHKF